MYLNYGMHYLVNAVTEAVDAPAAVLIRALEPHDGIDLMRRRRARGTGKPATSWTENGLCRGPGNLTKALGISLEQNSVNLTGSRLFIADAGVTLPVSVGAAHRHQRRDRESLALLRRGAPLRVGRRALRLAGAARGR